ncbi:MAG: UDP-3-O-(3-hydroxymyristoyl)glucosamine N-acyltransferase [Desulfobacterales bacterium]|nr:UDP-3-O-(3-hydroxymyristoyl)glucosamine N-acyltransferase [Desulfobacterales bacterium]
METTLGQLAGIVNGIVTGNSDKRITGASSFENATETDITYVADIKYLKMINQTKAGAYVISKTLPEQFRKTIHQDTIAVDLPQVAFTKLLQFFYSEPEIKHTIHPQSCIGNHCHIGYPASIGPYVVIQDEVVLGDRVHLMGNIYIGHGVSIGNDVKIYPNVTILDQCVIGNRVIIHSGTVIGSDGFGFAPDGSMYHKIIHRGNVQIDDDVEIGASNTIDRATFGRTWIQRGVKTDNLVHIAHNVTIGEHSILVAQVGIAGSTTIGKHVILAGQAGVSGHLHIGDRAIIGPKAGITHSVDPNQIMSGTPEMPHREWLKIQRILTRLPDIRTKLLQLEKRLDSIEKKGE